ncbi:MAG: hypothetical protein JJT78_18610 [Leptospira sp.]|nr:hypothetical protein [Leptospira sp.]
MKYFITSFIFFCITFFTNTQSISANSALSIYEKGYKLEKTFPIFAIPVYERVLRANPDAKLKKITATRLYYLFKKFRKYPELLNHYAMYRNILSIGSEHSDSISQIIKIYQISYSEYQAIYPIITSIKSENIGTLLDIIMESSSKNLFNFSYSYLMSNRKYDELRTIMFYLPESLALPILRIGLLVKMNDPNTEQVIQKFLEREDLNDDTKSDSFYLLGQYYLIQENYTSAEEYFRLSQKYGKSDRGKREIAKSFIAQGRISEACKLGPFPARNFHEADYLLYLTCTQKEDLIPEMQIAIDILISKESSNYFSALKKWHWK